MRFKIVDGVKMLELLSASLGSISRLKSFAVMVLLISVIPLAVSACSELGDESADTPDIVADGDGLDGDIEEAAPEPLEPGAGFVEIGPVAYSFVKDGIEKELTSSSGRMWYVFRPAEEEPEEKPLAIFFNGGPGSATGLLFGFNTAPLSMDPLRTGAEPYIESPANWATIANLLYVDARETGFSYNSMNNVEDKDSRSDEFTSRNFNSFFDGADFVRLLLRFLSKHPQIRKNPVIIAGESYGGIRATAMLYLLLNYRSHANGSNIYQDPDLVEEIQAHLDKVFPEYAGQEAPPEVIATQFGHQVLIQPLLSGVHQDDVAGELWEEEGSPLFQIADEDGLNYAPCRLQGNPDCKPYENAINFFYGDANRDIYNYTQPSNWMNDLADAVTVKLLKNEVLSAVLGMDVSEIDELYAANRTGAYRVIEEDAEWLKKRMAFGRDGVFFDQRIPLARRLEMLGRGTRKFSSTELTTGNLPGIFGELEAWDRYYVSSHMMVNVIFYINDLLYYNIDPYQTLYGDMFLKNLVYVNTFITNAAYDLIIYGNALPGALRRHTELVDSVDWQTEAEGGEERPGWITVHYKDDAFGGVAGLDSRKFRFPLYPISCHAVEITEPVELLDDVTDWWEATR